jgi:hypothetical protein
MSMNSKDFSGRREITRWAAAAVVLLLAWGSTGAACADDLRWREPAKQGRDGSGRDERRADHGDRDRGDGHGSREGRSGHDDRGGRSERGDRHGHGHAADRHESHRYDSHRHASSYRPWYGWWRRPVPRPYRGVTIYHHYGHHHPGYGWYRLDDDAYKWLAFTAISLKLLDTFNEEQQRRHESAQIRAASAPIGERIVWNDGDAYGSVTAVREGNSTSGRYCREFLHEVRIGGKVEQAYGTACRQPDGAWEIVSSGP